MTYRVTPEEAYRVGRMLAPRWIPLVIGAGAVLLLISGAVLVAGGQAGLGVLLVLWALFLLASRLIVRRVALRRIATRLGKVPEPIVVTIGPDGIRGERGKSSGVVSWADIVSVDVRGPFVWVEGRVNPVYAIPRRAFSGESDAQRFVTAANDFLAESTRA